MIFGYARVSTDQQSLDRQIYILKQYGAEEILSEHYTGTKKNRPQFDLLMGKLRNSDILVVESLSRLSRSSKDLLEICEILNKKEVKLVSLKENMNFEGATGKLLLTMLSALVQFERDTTSERVKDTLAVLKQKGVKIGRTSYEKKHPKLLAEAIEKYYSGNYRIREIEAITGVPYKTLYRYIKKLKENPKTG